MADTKNQNTKLDDTKPWRNWAFTFDNYSEINTSIIQEITGETCKYIIYGKEVSKSGTPHLQGYIEFYDCKRKIGVKKILDPLLGKKSKVHVEPANAGRFFNRMYCSKGLQSHEEYVEFGDKGPNYGINADVYERVFKEANEGRGKRTDWHVLYDRIAEEPDFSTILKEFPEHAMKYSHGIQKAIDTVIQSKSKESLEKEMNDLRLYNWELELLDKLESTPNKRSIMWYVDYKGGCGKSTFAKYLLSRGNCAYFTNAKSADIAHAYNGERTVIFDFTRSIEGRINYEIIEAIKNGVVFASKYASGLKVHATPHIICFSNFDPERAKLSEDRWDLTYLDENAKMYPEDGDNIEDDDNIDIPIDNTPIETRIDSGLTKSYSQDDETNIVNSYESDCASSELSDKSDNKLDTVILSQAPKAVSKKFEILLPEGRDNINPYSTGTKTSNKNLREILHSLNDVTSYNKKGF